MLEVGDLTSKMSDNVAHSVTVAGTVLDFRLEAAGRSPVSPLCPAIRGYGHLKQRFVVFLNRSLAEEN